MEVFRDIQGYEGLYEISNEGNVKSLNYNHTGNERILKPHDDGHGYLYVNLCKDGKAKMHQVHRLVASAFIENKGNLPQVNHKDENPSNNNADNLEWCTHEYNINYGTRNERVAEALSIPIDMFTKDGEFIRQFPSSMEAERWLHANGYYPKAAHTNINSCCKGRLQSCYGFKWRYAQGN